MSYNWAAFVEYESTKSRKYRENPRKLCIRLTFNFVFGPEGNGISLIARLRSLSIFHPSPSTSYPKKLTDWCPK